MHLAYINMEWQGSFLSVFLSTDSPWKCIHGKALNKSFKRISFSQKNNKIYLSREKRPGWSGRRFRDNQIVRSGHCQNWNFLSRRCIWIRKRGVRSNRNDSAEKLFSQSSNKSYKLVLSRVDLAVFLLHNPYPNLWWHIANCFFSWAIEFGAEDKFQQSGAETRCLKRVRSSAVVWKQWSTFKRSLH